MSPSRRVLLRDGHEVPLIARYYDLLVLLVSRRPEEDRLEGGEVGDRLRLGRALLEAGKAAEALEQAVAALRLSPEDAEANRLREAAREAGGDK